MTDVIKGYAHLDSATGKVLASETATVAATAIDFYSTYLPIGQGLLSLTAANSAIWYSPCTSASPDWTNVSAWSPSSFTQYALPCGVFKVSAASGGQTGYRAAAVSSFPVSTTPFYTAFRVSITAGVSGKGVILVGLVSTDASDIVGCGIQRQTATANNTNLVIAGTDNDSWTLRTPTPLKDPANADADALIATAQLINNFLVIEMWGHGDNVIHARLNGGTTVDWPHTYVNHPTMAPGWYVASSDAGGVSMYLDDYLLLLTKATVTP